MNYKSKKLLIYGTGAVGGYYGGMLVKAGYDVTFVARGENYKTLREKGLTLICEGKKEIIPINVVETLPALGPASTRHLGEAGETRSQSERNETSLQGKFDYIFICVKSMDTKEAAKNIVNNVGENTTVISFQNGVDNEDIIADIIGQDKVIGGLVFVASRLASPGVIEQFGYNGALIGELYSNEKLNWVGTGRDLCLQEILTESGIDCKISEKMRGELWNKLVWNASFNPLSVLTGKTVDRLLEEDYELIKTIMTEVKNVAVAHLINIRPDTVEFNLNRSKGFTGFKTSMLQDFEKGKPIELEELVGVVIKKAREKNVPVSNIERVYTKLKQQSKK